jgi:hypothetical protein
MPSLSIGTPAVTRRAAPLSEDVLLELCALERDAYRKVQAKRAAEQLGECFANVEWLEPVRIVPGASERKAA